MKTIGATHGVLLDVGYTLFDEGRRLEHSLKWMVSDLVAAELKIELAALRAMYVEACCNPRPVSGSLMVQLAMELGLEKEKALDLRRRMPWDEIPLEPYPDAKEALELFRKSAMFVGVLANQPASAKDDLDRTGLLPLLDDVWLSEPCGLAKPDARFFQLAMDAWKLPAGKIAYIGDRPDNDTEPAKKLGMHTVRVLLGPHRDQAERSDRQAADHTAATLTDAANYLIDWRD